MGYILHHAIVVTGMDHPHGEQANALSSAHTQAIKWNMGPSEIVTHNEGLNGYKSFLVPPDGSKEGWGESEDGDRKRDDFVAFLRSLAYDDGSSPVCWVEIAYGGDEPGKNTTITRAHGLRRKTERGT